MTKHARPFTSHVKMIVMTLTLPHAGRWFYQREIQLITGIAYTPVRQALLDLAAFGLLTKRTHGNRQYYTVNKDFFLYEEYKRIVFKTTGLGDHLRYRMKKDGDIDVAFVYGDFADGREATDTSIQFCAIGGMTKSLMDRAVKKAAIFTQKQYDCTHLSRPQFAARSRRKDPEWGSMLDGNKIFLVGKEQDLEKLGQ